MRKVPPIRSNPSLDSVFCISWSSRPAWYFLQRPISAAVIGLCVLLILAQTVFWLIGLRLRRCTLAA